jgi:hypothetical protein
MRTIIVYDNTFFLGKDTKACETGSMASLDLSINRITTDILTSRNALPLMFLILDHLCITKILWLLCISRYYIMKKID